jgi:hypothetical protein
MEREDYDRQLDIALRRGDGDEVKRLTDEGPTGATNGKYAKWPTASGPGVPASIPTNNPGTS